MDVWCNGQKMDTTVRNLLLQNKGPLINQRLIPLVDCPQGEFVDDGTETHFMVGEHDCCIKAVSSGKKKSGIMHLLLLDGEKVATQ